VSLSSDAPKIINNISVGGVQKILLNVQVMEVSRTKLRALGFDFSTMNSANDLVIGGVSGLISSFSDVGTVQNVAGETVRFGIVNNGSFFGFLKALRQHDLAKVLAEPKIVAVSGRPASFNVGGEIPIPSSQGLGSTAIKWKKYGTQVEFVPLVLGNGNIRLEVRPRVSELDATRTYVDGIPGLLVREVDTAVEMKAGQTLALAGLVQTRVESQNKGLPVLADIPFLGAAFRSVEYKNNEVELLILVRPEFIDPLDPHEVPPGGPGLNSCAPTDHQLYWKGFLEVPCKDGCPPSAAPAGLMGPPPEAVPAPPSDIPPGVLPPGAIPVTPPETIQPAAPASPPVSLPSVREEVSVSLPAARRPAIPRAAGNYRRDSEAPPPGLIGPIGYDHLK
jgi:pilus assembly protein CpaC